MVLVPGIEVLFLGRGELVVVLALAATDVVVGQDLAGQVVIVYDLDHYAAEDQTDACPLHFGQVMAVPSHVDTDC